MRPVWFRVLGVSPCMEEAAKHLVGWDPCLKTAAVYVLCMTDACVHLRVKVSLKVHGLKDCVLLKVVLSFLLLLSDCKSYC